MQVEIIDQQPLHTSSHLFHEMYFPFEKQVGKPNTKADLEVNLPANDGLSHHYGDSAATGLEREKLFVSTKEIDLQTIQNLLPDEEDLFSGLNNEAGGTARVNDSDDEEIDLFSTGGGMELEGDCRLHALQGNSDFTEGFLIDQGSSNGSFASEHRSRTLSVRNIDICVEDSELRVLFEQYGEIRTLYTACRYRGFVVIAYYDIRAARSAMCSLQNKPLRYGKLDIYYSIPKDNPFWSYVDEGSLEVLNLDSSISSNKLHQVFGSFGEIEQLCGTSQYHKLIKYYDMRAAEAALHGCKRSDSLLRQMKLVVRRPKDARSLMQQFFPDLVQGELGLCRSPNDKSLQEVSPGVMSPSCIKNGYIHGLHSAIKMPANASTENDLSQANFCFTNSLPSQVGMTSVCNQLGLREPHLALDQAKLLQHCTTPYPQFLPMYHYGFVDTGVITYNSLSNNADLASDIGPGPVNEINGNQLCTVDSNCPPIEHLVRSSSRTGSFPLNGHFPGRSNSNSFQHHPLTPMTWSSSLPFVNGVCAHSPSKPAVLVEALPRVLYSISPTDKHHIRSAPSGILSCGDLRNGFVGESPKALDLQLDPLRIVGFPSSSMLYPSDAAPHNISQVGGKCMDISSNSATSSRQNVGHMFPGRDAATTRPVSLPSPRERKKLSQRRHRADSCHADQKEYELDIGCVSRGEDRRTTLMIKNIPNKYNSKLLLAAIDEQNRGTYDFLYLPIDFKNKCNMGYAFINMIDPLQIIPFYKTFNCRKWEKFHSGKVTCLAYARIQGKAALIAHFQDSSLMNEDDFCHPILFVSDGPNAGDQEPFPMCASILLRMNRPRCKPSEENQVEESSSKTGKGEESDSRKTLHLKLNKLSV